MYRVLIVDDESYVVNWLYEMLKAEAGLNLDVYKAYTGEEALEWLNKTYIDVVLTDIYMPGIDGLALLKEIKNHWPYCKVILLTAHDDFEYIYEAIRYEGVKYLLKSESDQCIVQVLSETLEEIQKDHRYMEIVTKAEKDMKRAIPMMRREFLTDVADSLVGAEELSAEMFDSLEIPLLPEHPVLLMVSFLDSASQDHALSRRTNAMLVMESVFRDLLEPEISYAAILYERSYVLWFFQPVREIGRFQQGKVPEAIWNLACSRVKSTLDQVQSSCCSVIQMKASFAISESACSWAQVPKKCRVLKQLLNLYSSKGSGVIVSENDLPFREEDGISIPGTDLPGKAAIAGRIQILASYLEAGKREEFFYLLQQLCGSLKNIKSMNYPPAVETYYAVAVQLLSHINAYHLWEKIAFRCALYKLVRIDEHESWEKAVEYLCQLAHVIFEMRESEQQLRMENTLARLKKYIRENLSEELSIYSLGEIMHFNPVYLSRVFKQATGVTLSSYISDLRIKKAKELLEDQDNRIFEIAKQVGCASSNYFSRLFKKAVGMTPQQYRDKMNA